MCTLFYAPQKKVWCANSAKYKTSSELEKSKTRKNAVVKVNHINKF